MKNQTDHATVFWCKDTNCYLLCYDKDLEKLPSPNLRRIEGDYKKLQPYRIKFYNNGGKEQAYALRVLYKPVETARGKAPDGTVDLYCVVNKSWLDRMAWQYESAFLAGLTDEQLLAATKCEELNI